MKNPKSVHPPFKALRFSSNFMETSGKVQNLFISILRNIKNWLKNYSKVDRLLTLYLFTNPSDVHLNAFLATYYT